MASGRARRPQFVKLVNRTTTPLFCMDDGIPEVIEPGYKTVPVVDAKTGKGKTRKVQGRELPVLEIVGAGPNGEPHFMVIEYFAAERYKRQHPLMGSINPLSTDAKDGDYLLGVIDWDDDIDHLEQSTSVELIDRSQLGDDKQAIKVLRLAGRKPVPIGVIEDRRDKANRRQKAERMAGRDAIIGNPFGMETRNGARW